MSKYEEIYNLMAEDKWYTASELGVAPASMTAMVNRGMVEKKDVSPRQYRKIKNVMTQIVDILNQDANATFFVLYKENAPLGMMCSYDKAGGKILDCWGKVYNTSGVYKMTIGNQVFPL